MFKPLPFLLWIDEVVRTASFFADRVQVEKAWLHSDRSITSIVDFGEGYEQLFGDLAAEESIEFHGNNSDLSTSQRAALKKFIEVFKETYFAAARDGQVDSVGVLSSETWLFLEVAAKDVVTMFRGFREEERRELYGH
jgi:hypothetical protein